MRWTRAKGSSDNTQRQPAPGLVSRAHSSGGTAGLTAAGFVLSVFAIIAMIETPNEPAAELKELTISAQRLGQLRDGQRILGGDDGRRTASGIAIKSDAPAAAARSSQTGEFLRVLSSRPVPAEPEQAAATASPEQVASVALEPPLARAAFSPLAPAADGLSGPATGVTAPNEPARISETEFDTMEWARFLRIEHDDLDDGDHQAVATAPLEITEGRATAPVLRIAEPKAATEVPRTQIRVQPAGCIAILEQAQLNDLSDQHWSTLKRGCR